MSKVPVQKGKIVVDNTTYKNDTYEGKLEKRRQEMEGIRSGQTLQVKKPKK